MILQPATGVKDLNPQQVEINHLLLNRLSSIYKQWGYEEVSPPRIERLGTLMAGGAIGGGITSSVSRAIGSKLIEKAEDASWHGLLICFKIFNFSITFVFYIFFIKNVTLMNLDISVLDHIIQRPID